MYAVCFYDDGGSSNYPMDEKQSIPKLIRNALATIAYEPLKIHTIKIFSDGGKLLHTVERRGRIAS